MRSVRIVRWRHYLNRRMSRIVRMGNRSVAIVISTGPYGPLGTMADVAPRVAAVITTRWTDQVAYDRPG